MVNVHEVFSSPQVLVFFPTSIVVCQDGEDKLVCKVVGVAMHLSRRP